MHCEKESCKGLRCAPGTDTRVCNEFRAVEEAPSFEAKGGGRGVLSINSKRDLKPITSRLMTPKREFPASNLGINANTVLICDSSSLTFTSRVGREILELSRKSVWTPTPHLSHRYLRSEFIE